MTPEILMTKTLTDQCCALVMDVKLICLVPSKSTVVEPLS